LTPLQVAGSVVTGSLDAYRHEAAFYRNSASIPFAISVPGDVNREKAARMLATFKDTHAGSAQAGNPAILGNGAEIKPLGAHDG
jgi:phage portal protein BeeE